MQITTTISTALDAFRRRLVKVRRFGKDDIQTPIEAAPFGTDANPIKGMRAIYSETTDRGKQVIVGYVNLNQLAASGEHRLYSTDSQGNLKIFIWLKSDGTMELGGNTKHATRFEELQSGFNELRDDFNNFLTTYNAHVHATAAPGPPVPPTGAPVAPSTADIAGAKIDEIKTL